MAYINQIENKDTWPQPEMVDKIAAALNITSSELFEVQGCPDNSKLIFSQKFGKTLEEELISRIEKEIKEICKMI